MKQFNRSILPLFIAALAVSPTTLAANPAAGQDGVAMEAVTIEPGRTITPRQAAAVSRSAARVLVHIAEARAAIHDKDRTRADKELGAARALLEVIKAERPTTKVIDHIQVARKHLDYKATETLADDLIPIYSDLTEIQELVPVAQARSHLKQAQRALDKGDRKAADEALVAVRDALVYTELDLPVAATERYIASAQRDLAGGRYGQADKALDAAEAGVVYLSVEVESPLAQARDALLRAKRDYAVQRYGAVRHDLAAARRWLDQAAKRTDGVSTDAVARLRRQLDRLTKATDQEMANAGKTLAGAWHALRGLAEREAEKASIGWKQKRPAADIRADLIDAKQRVAFAENMQFYAESDPADIFKALDQARDALDKVAATGKLDGKASKELEQARSEIAALRQAPRRRNLYEIVRSRLRGLIHGDY